MHFYPYCYKPLLAVVRFNLQGILNDMPKEILSKRRQIDQFDLNGNLIKTFESMNIAVNETGVDYSSICLCCRGKRVSAKGFVFKYNNSNQKVKSDPLDALLFKEELYDDDEW